MKKSAGFPLTALSAVLAIVGLVFYFINCNTNYFIADGVNPGVIGCTVAAIVVEVLLIAVAQKGQKTWMDILPVAAPVLLMVGFVLFLVSRINAIAAIMTFTNSAENMADLQSCIISLACLLIGCIVAVFASFFEFDDLTGSMGLVIFIAGLLAVIFFNVMYDRSISTYERSERFARIVRKVEGRHD